MLYRIRAPFHVEGRWKWLTWDTRDSNTHRVILAKAEEINAQAWDFGQADHMEKSRANF